MRIHDALPAVMTTRQAAENGALALLRNGTYRRVGHGVYLVAGADRSDPDVRTAVATAGLPSGVVVGGWAAARVHERRSLRRGETALFDGGDRARGGPAAVLLLAGRRTRLVDTPFRQLVRSPVPPDERCRVDGLVVTTPLRTAFDLARLAPLDEGVVALDRLRAISAIDPDALGRLVAERSRWQGGARARRALALSADGVESPQESVLRLLWIEAGLPRPRCNVSVFDAAGAFVGRVDLIDPALGLVGEYDGAVHAAAQRRSRDAERQERLEALGLVVVRATATDVLDGAGRHSWSARLRRAAARARVRTGPRLWTMR
jgi:hypothetical protein